MRRLLNFALFLVVFILLIAVLVAGWLCAIQAMSFTHPRRVSPAKTPDGYDGLRWHDVSFTTSDGLTLSGWLILPSQNGNHAAILTVHGLGSSRGYFLPQAAYLAEQGYAVLLFDMRNHGTGPGDVTSMGYREANDVIAAYDFLAEQPEIDPAQIILYGHSMGGATAILAMNQLPEAQALIVDTSYSSLLEVTEDGIPVRSLFMPQIASNVIIGMSNALSGANLYSVRPIDVIGNIAPRPVLLIAGTDDELIPVTHIRKLYAAANEPKMLYIIDGGRHNDLYEAHETDYKKHLDEFLGQTMLKSKPVHL